MPLKDDLVEDLAQLDAQGLLRRRAAGLPATPELMDVCTNDYLGYARRVVSRETTARLGAGASRLIHGTHAPHLAAERELARWTGTDAALLFPSGYSANVGVLSALAQRGDVVVSDALNHASIVDGCRLSRATVKVVPHLDLRAVARALDEPAARRRWVVTESYFSMDADSPDLASLRALCDEHDAYLIVDEAHALGVFGPEGSGLCRQAHIRPDVLVGTLGKAVGLQGAFVAGSAELADFLWTRARSFVFTTAPSPLLAELALQAVKAVAADDAARERLARLGASLEARLRAVGLRTTEGRHGPIFPVLVGTPERALKAAASLRDQGFLAQAIRPPTVPPGSSRLRIALHADLPEDAVLGLAQALCDACAG